jgi:archaeosortase B (VPXXXP-CTERM-specific)
VERRAQRRVPVRLGTKAQALLRWRGPGRALAVKTRRPALSGAAAWSDRLWTMWDRHRPVLRYWLVFVAVLAAFHASLTVGERFWAAIEVGTAAWLAWSLSLLGHGAEADRTVVTSTLHTVTIVRECTAVHPIAVFSSAVLAYPLGGRARLAGIAAGVPALLVLNQVRLVTLCYIGRWYPAQFETAHLLVWQSLIMLLTAVLFLLWVLVSARR